MHIPVLLGAVIDGLSVRPGGTYVDCTAGGGGHSAAIARALEGSGRLICIDRDADAVARVRERIGSDRTVRVVHGDYGDLLELLKGLEIAGVDGVLIDAGVSSQQIDSAERGFSFQREGPLDMRMDRTAGMTAADLLNSADEDEIARILREFGDLKPARKIAAAIVARREATRFVSTTDLVETVRSVFHFVSGTPEEVRTVFQAIRIAVNREFESLERGIGAAIKALNPGGRLVCIAFHSGEDRIVKNALRDASKDNIELYPDGRVKAKHPAQLRILTSRPLVPGADEVAVNPRAQSAKLRIAEKSGAPA